VTVSQLAVSFELERYLLSVFFQSYFPGMIMVILGGLSMFLDAKSVPARVSMGVMTVLTTSTIIQGLKNSLPQVSYLTALDIYLWACFLFVFAAVLEYVALNIMVRQRANATLKASYSFDEDDEDYSAENGVSNGAQCNGRCSAKNGSVPVLNNIVRRNIEPNIQKSFDFKCHEKKMNGISGKHQNEEKTQPQKTKLFAVGRFKKRRFPEIKMSDWVRSPSNLEKKFRLIYFISFIAFNIAYWTYFTLSTRHKTDDD